MDYANGQCKELGHAKINPHFESPTQLEMAGAMLLISSPSADSVLGYSLAESAHSELFAQQGEVLPLECRFESIEQLDDHLFGRCAESENILVMQSTLQRVPR